MKAHLYHDGKYSLIIDDNTVVLHNYVKDTKRKICAWASYHKQSTQGRPHITIKREDVIKIGKLNFITINWYVLSWILRLNRCDGNIAVSLCGKTKLFNMKMVLKSGLINYINNEKVFIGTCFLPLSYFQMYKGRNA